MCPQNNHSTPHHTSQAASRRSQIPSASRAATDIGLMLPLARAMRSSGAFVGQRRWGANNMSPPSMSKSSPRHVKSHARSAQPAFIRLIIFPNIHGENLGPGAARCGWGTRKPSPGPVRAVWGGGVWRASSLRQKAENIVQLLPVVGCYMQTDFHASPVGTAAPSPRMS